MLKDILKNIGEVTGKENFTPIILLDEPICPEELI